jgi:PIN domain nuclease of toxin-antitoxin system
MIAAIADTRTAIWYLFSDARLGREASALIDSTVASGGHIGVSAISFAEMVYLIEKQRIPANALDDVLAAISDPKNVLKQVPLDDVIALTMRQIPRQDIPDFPDRIIAATALFKGVPVLSRDGRIRASNIKPSGDRTAALTQNPITNPANLEKYS